MTFLSLAHGPILDMADHALLVHVNSGVGVVVAVVGAVIAAPGGTKLLLGSLGQKAVAAVRRLCEWVARLLPVLRKRRLIREAREGTVAGDTASLTVSAPSGRLWIPSESVDKRIEALRTYLQAVEAKLAAVERLLDKETAARTGAVDRLDATLQRAIADLWRALAEQEHKTARVDARGLPVIAVGIVLSGLPELLAHWIYPLGWIWPLFAIVVAAAAAEQVWREAHPPATK